MKGGHVSYLAVAAAVCCLLSSCGKKEGEECKKGGECSSGHICYEGRCTPEEEADRLFRKAELVEAARAGFLELERKCTRWRELTETVNERGLANVLANQGELESGREYDIVLDGGDEDFLRRLVESLLEADRDALSTGAGLYKGNAHFKNAVDDSLREIDQTDELEEFSPLEVDFCYDELLAGLRKRLGSQPE